MCICIEIVWRRVSKLSAPGEQRRTAVCLGNGAERKVGLKASVKMNMKCLTAYCSLTT